MPIKFIILKWSLNNFKDIEIMKDEFGDPLLYDTENKAYLEAEKMCNNPYSIAMVY